MLIVYNNNDTYMGTVRAMQVFHCARGLSKKIITIITCRYDAHDK